MTRITMVTRFIILILSCTEITVLGQTQPVRVFAHNDYKHATPFQSSYDSRVDFIEADVFFRRGKLYVAHTSAEITEDRTLKLLYLEPLDEQIHSNNGRVYPEPDKKLTLMIDLKTDGVATLRALVDELSDFPKITACASVTIAVSGDVPPPGEWHGFPEYIHFDGRPIITYSSAQLERITLISASFRDYSSWNGRDEMSNEDRLKLESVISKVHSLGKPIRFWAAPDFEVAWKLLINLGVDVLNTDDVDGAVMFVRQ